MEERTDKKETGIFSTQELSDSPREECGVFGIYDFSGEEQVAPTIYYGLLALQHRGQESCGIAVSDTDGPKGAVRSRRGMGLVNENFNAESLEGLKGNIGVGHVRYSTAGQSTIEIRQPGRAPSRMRSRLFSTISRERWRLPTTEIWSMHRS